MQLLVLDDEHNIREMMKNYIEKNYQEFDNVMTCSDGLNGLKAVEKYKPDIIISDVIMPNMDGIEFISRVSRIHPDCLFIMISGHAEADYIRRSMKNSAIDYILKPIDLDEFDSTLKKVIMKYMAKQDIDKRLMQLEEQLYQNRMVGLTHIYKAISEQQLTDKYELIEQLDFYNVNLDINRVMISICIAIEDSSQIGVSFKIREINKMLLIDMIEKILDNSEINYFLCSFDQQLVSLVINVPEQHDANDYVINLCNIIDSNIKDEFGKLTLFGIGQTCKHYEDLAESCKSAVRAVLEAMVSDKPIVSFDSMLIDHSNYLNKLEISSVLKSIYNRNTWEFSKKLITQQLVDLFVDQLLVDVNFDETNDYSVSQRLVNQTIKIINEEYAEPINLQVIAQRLSVSPNYLGTLFREATGKKFCDVLTEKRMRIAEHLLLFETSSINDISAQSGFEDSNYFSKVFRKHYSMSPSEYREKYRIW